MKQFASLRLILRPWPGRDPATRKPAGALYKEMIEILDESAGVVVKSLRDNQLEKNTLIIFCSDNGPQAPGGFPAARPLKGRKGSLLLDFRIFTAAG